MRNCSLKTKQTKTSTLIQVTICNKTSCFKQRCNERRLRTPRCGNIDTNELFKHFIGEFDPGSGRTLAACLIHASRANLWELAPEG